MSSLKSEDTVTADRACAPGTKEARALVREGPCHEVHDGADQDTLAQPHLPRKSDPRSRCKGRSCDAEDRRMEQTEEGGKEALASFALKPGASSVEYSCRILHGVNSLLSRCRLVTTGLHSSHLC